MSEGGFSLLIEAKDEATAVLNRISGNVLSLHHAMEQLATKAGPLGQLTLAFISIGGAVVTAGTQLAETYKHLQLLSESTGIATTDLEVFKTVAEEMGSDGESLGTVFMRLNKAIAENDPRLRQLGITTRDTKTAFMELAQAFAGNSDMAAKSEIAFKLLGRGSKDFIAILPQLASHFDETKKRMEEAGAVIDEKLTPSLVRLYKDADQVSMNWKGIMLNLKEQAVPVALQITDAWLAAWDAITGKTHSVAALQRTQRLIQDQIEAQRQTIAILKNPASGLESESGAERMGARIAAGMSPEARLQRLAQAQAELDALDAKLGKTIGELQNAGGLPTMGPFIDRPMVGGGKGEKESARTKQVEALAASLEVTDAVALKLLPHINAITEGNKRDKKIGELLKMGIGMDELVSAGAVGELEAFNRTHGLRRPDLGLKPVQIDDSGYQRNLKAVLDTAPKVNKAVLELKTRWADMASAAFKGSQLLKDSADALYQGMGQGMSTVFANMTHQGQTFSQAMKTIFDDMVNAIMQYLAKLATLQIIDWLIHLLPGTKALPSATTVAGSPSVGSLGSHNMVGPYSAAPVTINVSALDARSVAESFASPRGGARAAMRSLALARAY